MPKVSVIIPVYNVEKYLRECLDSVVNQTLKDIEIICVNDGSTDNSRKILEEYAQKDHRIKIIDKANGGLSSARNEGMKYVTSEYIGFVDSDDWISLDFYEKLYDKCEKTGADVAIGSTLYYYSKEKIDSNGRVNNYVFSSRNRVINSIYERQNIIYSCAVWNKLYKTDLIRKNDLNFPEGLYIEDVPFNFATTILANKFVLVDDTYLYYRQQNGSIMKKAYNRRIPFDIFKIYEVCENFLENLDIKQELKLQYHNILQNFEIFNIYGWYNSTSKLYKKEFKNLMRKKFKSMGDISQNSFITNQSLEIYNSVLEHRFKKDIRKNIKKLFSVTYTKDKNHKIIKLAGIKFKFKVTKPILKENMPQELMDKIDNAEIVSFDIFDTLLLRPYVQPTDLFYHIEQNYNAVGYAEARINAEKEVRLSNPNKEDITYNEIYNFIDEKYKQFKPVELEYEEKLLFRNPEMYSAYLYAQKLNKKIIITSDMYLPKDFIERVLLKNGYSQYYKLYLSSELNKTKSSGNLYAYIINDLNTLPEKILHIGDNKDSDIKRAENFCIKTYYSEKLINKYLNHNKKARIFNKRNINNVGASVILMMFATRSFKYKNYWEKLGYEYGGPVIFGYVKWLKEQVEKDNIKNILFVARDGYSLEKVFNLLNDRNIQASYIYAPRFMSIICNPFKQTKELDRMRALVEYYKPRFSNKTRKIVQKLKSSGDYIGFVDDNKKLIKELALKEKCNYQQYLSSYIYSNEQNIAIVDSITLKFSSQRLIEDTLDKNHNVKGYYYARIPDRTVNQNNEYKYITYIPEPYRNKKDIHCWNFMELLMTAPEYPIRTVKNGLPVYYNAQREEKQRKNIVPIISDYTVKFTQDIINRFQDIPINLSYLEMCDWVNILADFPAPDDIKNVGHISHSWTANHDKYELIFPNWSGYKKQSKWGVFFKSIFSITNENTHKLIYILGIKIRIKSKNLLLRKKIDSQNLKIKSLEKKYKKLVALNNNILNKQNDYIEDFAKKIINKYFDNESKYLKDAYLLFDCLHDSSVECIDAYTLFIYMKSIGKNAYYALRTDTELYKQLKSENKLENIIPIYNSTKKYPEDFLDAVYDILLRAKSIITSFGENGPIINDFFSENKIWQYIFIQHGPTFLKETVLSNGYLFPEKFSKYLICSDYELKLFRNYDWDESRFIKVGLPRWDNLCVVNKQEKKSILVMMTWRKLNKDNYEDSLYKNNLLRLLNNIELNKFLDKNNIKIYFAPHHAMFHNRGISVDIDNENIELVDTSKISECVKKCSCLITDFSSIAFDFMFQEKPVIFYLLDKNDRELHKDDKNDLNNMVRKKDFLPNIFENEELLIKTIKCYVENNFELEPEVKEKYNKFFYTKENICEKLTNEIDKIC